MLSCMLQQIIKVLNPKGIFKKMTNFTDSNINHDEKN